MLGRDAELGELHAAIEAVSTERRSDRIVIVAPPGVGKSRLLAELALTTPTPPCCGRASGRRRPRHTRRSPSCSPQPDTSDLAAALAAAGVPDARASVIRQEVARLLEPTSEPASGGGDLAAERDARFDAWVSALDALAPGASVWLIEDVHWAGGDLLAFLDHAGRAADRVTAGWWWRRRGQACSRRRPRGAKAGASTWRRSRRPRRAALVRALLGTALPEQLVAAVVERSDGTPLFIEELLRTWASVGTLVLTDGAWHLAVQPESVSLPPTVQAIYAAQLDDLPPDARQVARRGAVAGRRVPLAAFASLELDGRGTASMPCAAARSWPARSMTRSPARATPTATHCLRDAGYASLARAERARLHVAMARWLAETAGDRADVVAEAVAEHHASALDSLPVTRRRRPSRPRDADGARPPRGTSARPRRHCDSPPSRPRSGSSAAHRAHRSGSPLDLARRRLRLGEILADSADLDAGIGEMEAALDGFAGDPAGTAAAAYALAGPTCSRSASPRPRSSPRRPSPACRRAGRRARPPPGAPCVGRGRTGSIRRRPRRDGPRLGRCAGSRRSGARARRPRARQRRPRRDRRGGRDRLGAARGEGARSRALAPGRGRGPHPGGSSADTDPRAALPRLEAAAELASAHGLTEQAGWVELLAHRGPLGGGGVGRGARARPRGDRARRAVRLPAARVPDLGHPAADRGRPQRRFAWPSTGSGGGLDRPTTSRPRRRRTRACCTPPSRSGWRRPPADRPPCPPKTWPTR